jgi:hypothetical protein
LVCTSSAPVNVALALVRLSVPTFALPAVAPNVSPPVSVCAVENTSVPPPMVVAPV